MTLQGKRGKFNLSIQDGVALIQLFNREVRIDGLVNKVEDLLAAEMASLQDPNDHYQSAQFLKLNSNELMVFMTPKRLSASIYEHFEI